MSEVPVVDHPLAELPKPSLSLILIASINLLSQRPKQERSLVTGPGSQQPCNGNRRHRFEHVIRALSGAQQTSCGLDPAVQQQIPGPLHITALCHRVTL